MNETVISSFKVDMLSAHALAALKFAVMHAKKNRSVRWHAIPISVFCSGAGLPNLAADELSSILHMVFNASFVVESIDIASPDRDDLPFCSWKILTAAKVDSSSCSFEICDRILEEESLFMLESV
jgi:hypothetical protein